MCVYDFSGPKKSFEREEIYKALQMHLSTWQNSTILVIYDDW